MRTRITRACVALVLMLAASCDHGRAQLLIRVSTDMPQGPDQVLRSVTIAIRADSIPSAMNPLHSYSLELGDAQTEVLLPLDIVGVSPTGNDASHVITVDTTAIGAGGPLFTNTHVVTFRADETQVLDVFLAGACVSSPACAAGMSCGANGCAPVMDAMLPLFDGGLDSGCPAGVAVCAGNCVDTSASPMNCGGCGIACASGVCVDGACCAVGNVDCNGRCVDPTSDTANCGACGVGCGTGGACCASACINESSDPMNCGRCGNACATDEFCSIGLCTHPVGVAVGERHVCAWMRDGTVRCWGENDVGQLGPTMTDSSEVPVPVPGLSNVQFVSAGVDFSCAIEAPAGTSSTPQLYCWGTNTNYELGEIIPPTPIVHVAALDGVLAVAAAGGHACAVVPTLTSGVTDIDCWGAATAAQLGGGCPPVVLPPPVAAPGITTSVTGTVSAIVASGSTNVVLADGHVLAWGENGACQAGDNPETSPICTITDSTVTASVIASDATHTCSIDGTGEVYCWGQMQGSTSPIGAETACTLHVMGPVTTMHPGMSVWPPLDAGVMGAQSIAAGNDFDCAIVAGGILTCWGKNTLGQLGNATASALMYTPPAPVTFVDGGLVEQVSAAAHVACAVVRLPSTATTVECWGDDSSFQLGRMNPEDALPHAVDW